MKLAPRYLAHRSYLPLSPAERLAGFRIAVAAYAVVYTLVRSPVLWRAGDGDPARFEPVGVLRWLDGPPTPWLAPIAVLITVAAGALTIVGWRPRVTGPLLAAAFLVVATLRASWGQLLWFDNVAALHLLVVAVAPVADAWSVEARSVEARSVEAGRRTAAVRQPDAYTDPLALAAVITVVAYVLAGVAKLRLGGADWLSGDSLRNHVAYSAVRFDALGGPTPWLARAFVAAPGVAEVAAVATVALELAAPVALLGRRPRLVIVAGLWLIHAGIALTMFVVFPYPLVGVAFLPLFLWRRGH